MTYVHKSDGILVKEDMLDKVGSIDAIIFDCDGVLVDVSKSYDLAIIQVTQYVLEKFAGIQSIQITPEIIGGFKDSGGFNDEVDVTYACILCLAAAERMGVDAKKFILAAIKNADKSGIESIERFLLLQNADVSDLKEALDYPGPHATNPLYVIFDQMFYGPELYYKIFGKKSSFEQPGLIENDLVIITDTLLDALGEKFGRKIAIVTGRGLASVRHSLGELLDRFDVASSMFLEDEPRSMAKPNPESLLSTIKKLDSKHCMYVGDSMEDLLMANQANRLGIKTTFCGIYGTNKNPRAKKEFFEDKDAPLILESINLLPKALNLA
ncbi:MAG: HAD family hydrolase [Candidatus Nitrosotenuis sp.]|nr:HAD family hydrolase [Candidatus Nitrosotenuis sp.]